MNNFWQGFFNGLSNSMFYSMFGGFMPCCGNFGVGMSVSVFSGPPMGSFSGFYSSASIFSPMMAMSSMTMPVSTPMPVSMPMPMSNSYSAVSNMSVPVGIPVTQNWNTNYNIPFNFPGGFSPGWSFNPVKPNGSQKASNSPTNITYDAKTLYQKWSKKGISDKAELSEAFCQKVIDIGNRTNCEPDDIMAIMYHETRFNPHKPNKRGFVGLIQFGAQSRQELGVPGRTDAERKDALMHMSSMEQLDYVEKYIMTARRHRSLDISYRLTLAELAALALYPAHVKQNVVIDKNSSNEHERDAYNANSVQDLNHDGQITKDELVQHIRMAK